MSGLTIQASKGSPYVVYLDEQVGVSYVGKAAPKSATSAPVWQIQRLLTTGAVLSVTFADGDRNFDNVWDDRASLTYS
jgi:hypothetical protein